MQSESRLVGQVIAMLPLARFGGSQRVKGKEGVGGKIMDPRWSVKRLNG